MSHPSRPQGRSLARRRRRQTLLDPVHALEERQLLAPFVVTNAPTVTFTAAPTPTNANLGTATVNLTGGAAVATSAAAYTSVAELTPISSFGGDIVNIAAGPGGDFGKGVYAISRGAGANTGAVNRPGVIYRVDPATGKSSVFFDLNTVLSQEETGGTAANSAGAQTGLVNWYQMAFDPEGYFDGRPSLFVTSIDRTDPNKNVIFRIGPDGSFLGAYITFNNTASGAGFTFGPSAILVPPPEQQSFLRGLVAGTGFGTDATGFQALFFNSNVYRPGTNVNSTNPPAGVTSTNLDFGPQVGLTAASLEYPDNYYSAFTNFGTPGAGGIPAAPGLSGVQGDAGDLIINNGAPIVTSYAQAAAATPDTTAAIITPFRRFDSIAYDQYGYFSYGTTVTTSATTGVTTVASQTPTYVGNLFVADLAPGLTVQVTGLAPLPTTTISVPVQGTGPIGVTTDANGNLVPVFTNGNTTGGGNVGGRIIRISPTGVVSTFAAGFHTSGDQTANGLATSDLSISFSADGTILYAADQDGIWQFMTVTSLANSTTGSLVGLNDLRNLGVPYEGQDSAVAVIDTGVDSLSPPLRGRVSTGYNTTTKGFGNDDTSAGVTTGTAATLTGVGHGTPLAGIITQFVPQVTIDPINIFTPNQVTTTTVGATTPQTLWNGLQYLAQHPFVADPVRPNTQDRVIAADMGFGTTSTYDTEGSAYRANKQLVIALENQFKKFRSLGIAPIAAAGQFGGTTSTTATTGDVNGISLPAVLNNVISVTGSYPFPYVGTAATDPTNPGSGVVPRPVGPVLLFGNGTTITGLANQNIVTGDNIIFKDKILVSSNRSITTDYAAPEIDVPTFSRTFLGDAHVHNVFNLAGTSFASAVVTGSFALVSSAIDYWSNLAKSGVTTDAYLTQPVGVDSLNYGAHNLIDLSAYSNPDSINAILQWTAVPITDSPNSLDLLPTKALFGGVNYRQYSRVSVSNAIAAIEGTVALNYLNAHNTWSIIDSNHDGLVTAAELQAFEDNANTIGLPEAGAMARLLGGTARITSNGFQTTAVGESPDQPDVLQRRFNFFDYIANGSLKGAIPITAMPVLAKNLLPAPDAFVVNDRQRASATGYLVSPPAQRNYSDLQHILPTYAFVSAGVLRRYQNVSPARFGIDKGQLPGTTLPLFTLFSNGAVNKPHNTPYQKPSKSSSPTTSTPTPTAPNPATPTTSTTSTQASTTTTTGNPNPNPTGTTETATGATTTTSTGPTSTTGSSSSSTTASTNSTNYAQSIADTLKSIAQGTSATTSSTTTTNGTQQPIAPGTAKPAGTLASESTAPTTTASTPSQASSGTSGSSSSSKTTATTPKAARSKPTSTKKGFFNQLYDNVSKLWGHKS
jgi:hypothetical protein